MALSGPPEHSREYDLGQIGEQARVQVGEHQIYIERALVDAGLTDLLLREQIETQRLSSARQLFARLPCEQVPNPAPLPAGSRMSHKPNPLFVGRRDELRAVAQQIAAGAPSVGLVGLGGVGKSQLASEFVHRYGQYFAGGVFWLSFVDAASVPAEVAACGGPDGMDLQSAGAAGPAFTSLPLEAQWQRVLRAWRSPLPRLLVFDGCEDEALLDRWRPATGGCQILVTSRRTIWDASLGLCCIPVGPLDRDDSVGLLRKRRPDLSPRDPDLASIAEELGDLALALDLAGRFLADNRYYLTPADYLAQLRSPRLLEHVSLHTAGYSPTGHVLSVALTFQLSTDALSPTSNVGCLARDLLTRAACLTPGESIPRELLHLAAGRPDEPSEAATVEDAIDRLVELGLLAVEIDGALRLHRLLSRFVQHKLPDPAARPAVEAAILQCADRPRVWANPLAAASLLPHLRLLADTADTGTARAAELARSVADVLHAQGALKETRPYYDRALAIREEVLGPEHPDTAMSLEDVGALLHEQNNNAAARPYFERTLAIRETALGPTHPDTATSLTYLGAVLHAEGDHAEARTYFERALAIREQVLGSSHPDTATSLNYLGALLAAQGEFTEALSYYERALEIRGQVLGLAHPDTATSLNNVGALLHAQGRDAEALPYFERALAIREQALGPTHPETATSLYNLGVLLSALGNETEARTYFERALTSRK